MNQQEPSKSQSKKLDLSKMEPSKILTTDNQEHSYLRGQNKIEELNPNNWANIKDQYLLQPIFGGDGRVLIHQDEYKSRFDCITCGGSGHTGETCRFCLGTKYDKGKEENGACRDCTITSNDRISGREGTITLGKTPCPTCQGKGGTIIIPDEAKTKTTMGNVLAVSEHGIKHVKQDDKVQYTNYTGISYEFMGMTLVVAHEKDLLCIVKKVKVNAPQIEEQKLADKENYGVPHE